jgi:hypothetical protein
MRGTEPDGTRGQRRQCGVLENKRSASWRSDSQMGGAEQTCRKDNLKNETRKHHETVLSAARFGHWSSMQTAGRNG